MLYYYIILYKYNTYIYIIHHIVCSLLGHFAAGEWGGLAVRNTAVLPLGGPFSTGSKAPVHACMAIGILHHMVIITCLHVWSSALFDIFCQD